MALTDSGDPKVIEESTAAPGVPDAPPAQALSDDLDKIYETRFSHADAGEKDGVWREVSKYLQRFVDPTAPVLDVATDRGHFIRHIKGSERWATDIRDVSAHLGEGIKFVKVPGPVMSEVLPNGHFGTVFMSNYLEHLDNQDVVVEQLRQAHKVLRPGGRVVILQPNIRLVGGAYWDFLDHKTALTDKSLVEACELSGFTTEKVIVRFLPFTTKSRLPQARMLVRAYLAFPPAWRILGKQTVYVGRR